MPDIADLERMAAAFDGLIEHWFFEAFHGSAVSRTTESWNAVFAAKDELKRRISAFIADNAAAGKD